MPQDGKPEYAFIGRSNVGKSSLINMLETWEELPPVFVTSSEKRQGREELLSYIEQINKAYK